MKSPAELTDLFREQRLKVTPQRQAIFRILHRSSQHPTAEAVFAQARAEMPTISLRTVYQTLNDLSGMGELRQIDLGTGSARFDPNLGAHHHLVCDACGTVFDLEARFPDVAVPVGMEQGFTISDTQIVFRGQCASCASGSADETQPNNKKDPRASSKAARPKRT